jgi:hypothetical protein
VCFLSSLIGHTTLSKLFDILRFNFNYEYPIDGPMIMNYEIEVVFQSQSLMDSWKVDQVESQDILPDYVMEFNCLIQLIGVP